MRVASYIQEIENCFTCSILGKLAFLAVVWKQYKKKFLIGPISNLKNGAGMENNRCRIFSPFYVKNWSSLLGATQIHACLISTGVLNWSKNNLISFWSPKNELLSFKVA